MNFRTFHEYFKWIYWRLFVRRSDGLKTVWFHSIDLFHFDFHHHVHKYQRCWNYKMRVFLSQFGIQWTDKLIFITRLYANISGLCYCVRGDCVNRRFDDIILQKITISFSSITWYKQMMGIIIIKARMTSSIFHDLSALWSSKLFCVKSDVCF